ncbi:hypothetical protein XA68_17660 [Ophiocordyceps unilateralis]|uniref:Protein-lysine N-methyltransferase EFM6 n=1 Tax=Ophiocordyceps unilateralis TaxID=268505 RepID=A0A2A9P476_OPHUN|nr:hypothetical protein XA68_17660 [Ophiocordyceps unilateralis]
MGDPKARQKATRRTDAGGRRERVEPVVCIPEQGVGGVKLFDSLGRTQCNCGIWNCSLKLAASPASDDASISGRVAPGRRHMVDSSQNIEKLVRSANRCPLSASASYGDAAVGPLEIWHAVSRSDAMRRDGNANLQAAFFAAWRTGWRGPHDQHHPPPPTPRFIPSWARSTAPDRQMVPAAGGIKTPPVDTTVVAVSEELTPLPMLKQPGIAAIDFDGQLKRPLRYHEDVRTGCGGQTWPAGLVLAKHMLRYHRHELRDANILELGAGGGLVGLAVALGCSAGKGSLLLTDQEEMLGLMQRNIRLNDVGDKATALVLNWGQGLPEAVVRQRPKVVLAADCVYLEAAFPLLLQTLEEVLAVNGEAVVYFCFKKRRRADMQFVKMAKRAFAVEELLDEDRPLFQRQSLFLLSFRRKTNGTSGGSGGGRESAGSAAPKV